MLISILIILISIIFAGLFSGLETGNYTLNRVRLHYKLTQDKPGRKIRTLAKNISDPQLFIFTTLVCHNLFVFIASTMVTHLYIKYEIGGEEIKFLMDFIPWSSEIAATLTLMLPIFIFGEIGPKNLFRINSDVLMYLTAGIQRFCIVVCLPVTWPLKFLSAILTRSKDFSHEMKNITMQKLKYFLTESRQGGVISSRQSKIISNIMVMHTLPITQVMISLEAMKAIPVDSTVLECLGDYQE